MQRCLNKMSTAKTKKRMFLLTKHNLYCLYHCTSCLKKKNPETQSLVKSHFIKDSFIIVLLLKIVDVRFCCFRESSRDVQTSLSYRAQRSSPTCYLMFIFSVMSTFKSAFLHVFPWMDCCKAFLVLPGESPLTWDTLRHIFSIAS